MDDRYLFKAKRIDNGEWIIGHYVNGGFIITMNHLECVDIDENTVCQCTGLKDDNGNLIWENDVVRVYGDTDDFGNDLYYFYKVVWNKDLCCWWLSDIYTQEDEYLYICLKEIDVIGNIFDNPELLER
ncbi:MAG: YopX family protein [Clostridium sp.]